MNRKFNQHTQTSSSSDLDIEIVSNLGDSFYDTREIKEDPNTAIPHNEALPTIASTQTATILQGFKLITGTGGVYRKQTTPPKFPADFHQHQPFAAFKRVIHLDATSGNGQRISDDVLKRTATAAEEMQLVEENGLSNSMSSISWKFLDESISSGSHHSPSISEKSDISHHLLEETHQSPLPLSPKASSWSKNSIKTGDLVDDVLDSLVLPSPVISVVDYQNAPLNHHGKLASAFSDDEFQDMPTPRTSKKKIPNPSNLDILNAYIAQFQSLANAIDIDALAELIKSNRTATGKGGSDPW